MDCFNFKISKTTYLRLEWADSVLNSTNPISLAFKNTFIKSKADKTLSKDTYVIPAIFIINSLVTTELASRFPASHLKHFLISNRQDLAITDSLNPKPFINEITLENIQAYNAQFEQTFCYPSYFFKIANISIITTN